MKDLIKELELKVERLEYENRLKTGLISILSHDSVGIYGSFLWLIDAVEQETISHEDFFKLLPQVKRDAKKNLQTVQDSTEWLKTQFGKFQIQVESIKVIELFQVLQDQYSEKLQKKNVSFEFMGDGEKSIETDRFLIEHVLNKLLNNAVKYSKNGQVVYLKSFESEGESVLSIIDSGIGISDKNLNTVFSFDNPVFEGTNGELGAGLGLKIVENFVSLVNGSMKIESSENMGTTVSLFLPKI